MTLSSSEFFILLLLAVFSHGADIYQPAQTIIVGIGITGLDIDDANQILAFSTYEPFFKVYKNNGITFSKFNQIDPGNDAEDIDITADGKFIFGSTFSGQKPSKLMKYVDSTIGYSVVQDIKFANSFAGFITNDYQLIGSAAR